MVMPVMQDQRYALFAVIDAPRGTRLTDKGNIGAISRLGPIPISPIFIPSRYIDIRHAY
jgi:hypothetical protein